MQLSLPIGACSREASFTCYLQQQTFVSQFCVWEVLPEPSVGTHWCKEPAATHQEGRTQSMEKNIKWKLKRERRLFNF